MSRVDASGATRAWHFLVLVWVGTLWGVQPALTKVAIGGALSEIESLAFVLLCTVLLVGGYLAVRGRLPQFSRAVVAFIAIAGFLEFAAPLLTSFVVAAHIDAGLLALITATTPVFTLALAAAVGTEALRVETVAACILGLVAMALIVVPEDALPSPEMLPWCLAAFAIPAFYACGSVYVARNWPAGFDPVQAAFAGSLGAALMLTPFWIRPVLDGSLAANTTGSSWALIALILSVVLEMTLYMYLLRNAGPVFTSFASFVMIASGFVAGMALFGERPSAWVWTSVAVFVLSLALIIRKPRPDPA